jgi:hypothetical protein
MAWWRTRGGGRRLEDVDDPSGPGSTGSEWGVDPTRPSVARERRWIEVVGLRILPPLALFGIASVTIFGRHGYQEWLAREREVEGLRRQVLATDDQNERLLLRIRQVQGDAVALERLVADELKLARPGATLYEFDDGGASVVPRAAP